ncbi:S41 family peptidase [Cohnella terricola]|uniref:PDZ domain-containing protein n=1 Tax=Cohnella terricola TaxID=1289167 RepID=A0A559J896_9BACL|nr:S41 family peptidase [Cohnella terricola]TVX96081.1 PDZ domain-containing protein [Cohnella terricola]
MLFRGRTVAAMMVLTAVAACVATYALFEFPEWKFVSSGAKASETSPSGSEGLSQDELYKLNKTLSLIERRYALPMEREQLIDGAIQGMVESLHDPYSVYKPEEEAEKFSDALHGAFTGIGAELRIENGSVIVESPIRGTPAERAGLKPLDVLLSINGESLNGLTLSEAVSKIRGPKGTKVKLKVQRRGVATPLDLELVRDRINPETVDSGMAASGVGYLSIYQFTDETAAQVKNELEELEAQGLKALVVDVRDNPGGFLQSVVEVADQLLEKGKPIVQSEYRDGTRKVDVAAHGAKGNKPYPIVVLMNKGSASAAEILAGALKQSAGAVLIGETTYGKGTVQVPFNGELGDRSILKLTVYKWLLPDGTWINEKGIDPDVRVKQPTYFQAWRLPRDNVLKYDTTGEPVENLQNILLGAGFPPDRKDGYFSEGTKKAVESFQKSESLPVTGEVDEETAQRLEEKLYAKIQDRSYDAQWQAAISKAGELLNMSKRP